MDTKGKLAKQMSTPKGRLRWFFDFLNTDLKAISMLDALPILYGLKDRETGEFPFSDDEVHDSPEEREKAQKTQKLLKDVLEGIFACKAKRAPAKENESPLDAAIRSKRMHYGGEYPIRMKMFITVSERATIEPSDDKHKVLLRFMDDLSKFSIDAIKKCERRDCQKYFFKATKKEKRYCSDRCAWVMNSRKRRAKNPEKEKEKKRKSYAKRMKQLTGGRVTPRHQV